MRKSLGQHLLCDENILKIILDAAELSGDDLVIEIGAGLGTVTLELAKRVGKAIAVEIDPRLVPILRANLQSCKITNVEILNQDFLKLNLEQIVKAEGAERAKAIGNLPYRATSPILEKLVEEREALDSAVLTIQLEVAEKITAPPGPKTGALRVLLQSFADVSLITKISRNVFFPRPEVDSALIKLQFLEKPRFSADEELFLKVVRSAFNLRRKTIKRALIGSPFLRLAEDSADQALKRAGIDPQRRGETLTIEEFDRLAAALKR